MLRYAHILCITPTYAIDLFYDDRDSRTTGQDTFSTPIPSKTRMGMEKRKAIGDEGRGSDLGMKDPGKRRERRIRIMAERKDTDSG